MSVQAVFRNKGLRNRIDFINLARKGVDVKTLHNIMTYTSLTNQEMVNILPISQRQLARYDENHLLKKEITAHLIQLFELFQRGFDVLGNDSFKKWVRTENPALGHQTPVTLLDTSLGIELVEDILGRIEHGVYS